MEVYYQQEMERLHILGWPLWFVDQIFSFNSVLQANKTENAVSSFKTKRTLTNWYEMSYRTFISRIIDKEHDRTFELCYTLLNCKIKITYMNNDFRLFRSKDLRHMMKSLLQTITTYIGFRDVECYTRRLKIELNPLLWILNQVFVNRTLLLPGPVLTK